MTVQKPFLIIDRTGDFNSKRLVFISPEAIQEHFGQPANSNVVDFGAEAMVQRQLAAMLDEARRNSAGRPWLEVKLPHLPDKVRVGFENIIEKSLSRPAAEGPASIKMTPFEANGIAATTIDMRYAENGQRSLLPVTDKTFNASNGLPISNVRVSHAQWVMNNSGVKKLVWATIHLTADGRDHVYVISPDMDRKLWWDQTEKVEGDLLKAYYSGNMGMEQFRYDPQVLPPSQLHAVFGEIAELLSVPAAPHLPPRPWETMPVTWAL